MFEIVGESPQFKRVLELSGKIAKVESLTTVIVGESGTGKEQIARLIHHLSHASTRPFVDVNCGALPETLLESELFGHEKGAFTGAQTQKQGLFEWADGGTIFLDEIVNTSPGFQAKLLKVVENKRFRRVNGLHEIEVSTRIIAATNASLKQAVKTGAFRQDLYYRLNICPIHIPPLRQRGRDSLKLAQHFIRRFNAEYGLNVRIMTEAAKQFVLRYPWPGNVRQLRNTLERAMVVECDDTLDVEHLRVDSLHCDFPPAIQPEERVQSPLRQGHGPDGRAASWEGIERDAIKTALIAACGNVSEAARILHVNRGKLRYRMGKLGIPAFQAQL